MHVLQRNSVLISNVLIPIQYSKFYFWSRAIYFNYKYTEKDQT